MTGKTPRFKILIVDDEPGIREILREEFEMAGAAVTEASSGREALEFLESGTYQAVLSDLQMPGGDGAWLLNQIVLKGWTELRFFLLTVYSERKFEEKLVRRMSGLFAKPFQVTEIVARVTEGLGEGPSEEPGN